MDRTLDAPHLRCTSDAPHLRCTAPQMHRTLTAPSGSLSPRHSKRTTSSAMAQPTSYACEPHRTPSALRVLIEHPQRSESASHRVSQPCMRASHACEPAMHASQPWPRRPNVEEEGRRPPACSLCVTHGGLLPAACCLLPAACCPTEACCLPPRLSRRTLSVGACRFSRALPLAKHPRAARRSRR